mmetsp:Transcript_12958/g.19121  ORF Transcript_12958/g.19121 Transcript_12958/m.19121 type:complete len:503 (-) Transcript_12958:108-1616(-)
MKQTNLNPTMIRYSLATAAVDTANRLERTLHVGRDRMVPEFNFMDPRAVGAWDASEKHVTEAAVWAMDQDEAGKDGAFARPPPNEDGTPHETLADQVVRLNNLMSVLETQFSGESILLIFPDGTGPALLSCMMAGIPLNRVHELEYASGEVRTDVNYETTLALLKDREEVRRRATLSTSSEEEEMMMDEYQLKLEDGRKQLAALRKSDGSMAASTGDQFNNNMALSKKYRQEEEEQRAIEANMQALAQQREKEANDQRLERQRLAAQVEVERQEQRQREGTEREARRQQRLAEELRRRAESEARRQQRLAEDQRRRAGNGVFAATAAANGPKSVGNMDPFKAIIGTMAFLGIGAIGTQKLALSSTLGDWESSFEEEVAPTNPKGNKMTDEEIEALPEPPVPSLSPEYVEKGMSRKEVIAYTEKHNAEYWKQWEADGKSRYMDIDDLIDLVDGRKNIEVPTVSVYDDYDMDDDDAWLNVVGDIMSEDDEAPTSDEAPASDGNE